MKPVDRWSEATPAVRLALKAALDAPGGLLDRLPIGIYACDTGGVVVQYNRRAAEIWGRTPEPEDGGTLYCGAFKAFRRNGEPLDFSESPTAEVLRTGAPAHDREVVIDRPDGTRLTILANAEPLLDPQGRMIGAVNTLVDISERKIAEVRQKALVDELNHRVKNTLATVQSLATQTLRRDDVPNDVRNAFEARLFALSRAHNQLSNGGWRAARMSAIVDGIFAPFGEDDGRIRFGGANVDVAPQTALILAMVIHELASNALKFDSLSTPTGTLDLRWQVIDGANARALRLEWTEAGGPPVAPPRRSGFGSRLIERGVEQQLNGAAELVFDPAGFHCRIEVPLSARAA